MRTLFKGGTVITGRGPKRADVLVEGEKVRQVGRLILTPADRTVDVEGCLLFPGFIDAHTHFDLDVCNTTTADDFTTGSRAALKGGTTTVIDFACPNKGESLQYGLDLWHKKADGRTFCDYGFHMTIDDWNESIRAELPEMFANGELNRIYLNFSDPWPKARHAKRRLTSTEFLARYNLVLAADGQIEFKTDNMDLFDFSLESVEEAGWKFVGCSRDLHHDPTMNEGNIMTEYEEKFSAKGNPIYKLVAIR